MWTGGRLTGSLDKMTAQLKANTSITTLQHANITCMWRWITNRKSVITSADGPIVAPAYIAVCHSETADALRALQFITFIAREMHCGSPPADPSQRGKNGLTAKVSWKNTKVLSGSGAADNVVLIKTHRGHKPVWNNLKHSS